ncbi:MAG: hypothetical protein LPK07_00505 [Hymenobacteraceae bacterium]|nr:hypothetical protein [Hymenobacteraceae bacterium]MDX5480144.1 hypothetical protein [Hymenobacteraceae bacterium]
MSVVLDDFLQIRISDSKGLLHAKWLRSVSSEELRIGLQHIKDVINARGISYWLADARNLQSLPLTDQKWVLQEIAPLLVSSNLQKIARIISNDIFCYISFEEFVKKLKGTLQVAIDLEQFTSEEAAMAWLMLTD